MNALLGRTAAVTSPIAGTTRDFVSATIALAGLVCRVVDAPGFTEKISSAKNVDQPNSSQSQSAIDQAAIMRAQQEILNADLVVALAAPNQTWPEIDHPHILRARSMCDIAGAQADTPIQVSALTGAGLIEFAQAVREKLVPAADLVNDRPWHF